MVVCRVICIAKGIAICELDRVRGQRRQRMLGRVRFEASSAVVCLAQKVYACVLACASYCKASKPRQEHRRTRPPRIDYASRTTIYTRAMHQASCIMHHASCIMHHASCIMHHNMHALTAALCSIVYPIVLLRMDAHACTCYCRLHGDVLCECAIVRECVRSRACVHMRCRDVCTRSCKSTLRASRRHETAHLRADAYCLAHVDARERAHAYLKCCEVAAIATASACAYAHA
jgi:hypothetical protein